MGHVGGPDPAALQLECRLESAHSLAALLGAMQLRERDQKDQRVHCEASAKGLKFVSQSVGKDAAVLGWIFDQAFKEYRYAAEAPELHLRLPVAPLRECLQIFSDRAALVLRYPGGPSNELGFTLEEDGAVTECSLKTLVLEEAPAPIGAFFVPGVPLSVLRPGSAEAWHFALAELQDMDAPDVPLSITVIAVEDPLATALVLRARTVSSDAEVELPRSAFEELSLAPGTAPGGQVTHRYLLSSVLASSLKASREAKAAKIRFNQEGVMSCQYILRGRAGRDLLCEALVSPLSEAGDLGAQAGVAAAVESLGF